MSLYTETSVTRHLQSWCAANGKHDSPGLAAYHAHFDRLLAAKRAEQRRPHDNQGLFGMASSGGCLRAQALKRAKIAGRPLDGDSIQTYEIGHLVEVMAGAVLLASGFDLIRSQEAIRLEPAFASAIDGVLSGGPVALPYPLLLSIKSSSYKSSQPPRGNSPAKRYGFAGLMLDGLRRAEPTWYLQSQLEMAATGLAHSLVLVVAKDMIAAFKGDSIFKENGSLTFYAELIPAVPASIAMLREAYEAVLAAQGDPSQVLPIYFSGKDGPVELPNPGEGGGWGGPNQAATGRFNPCGKATDDGSYVGCPYVQTRHCQKRMSPP